MQMKSCFKKLTSKSSARFLEPLIEMIKQITPLVPGGDQPLPMTFENQLRMLISFHIGKYTPVRHMLKIL